MYKLFKNLGYIVTFIICAITIDKIDVTQSFFLRYFVITPIINEMLWALSYYTCKKIVYQKLDTNLSTIGSIGYTISYTLYALILYAILMVLKTFGIIPFANDFDDRLINFIMQYSNNLIIDFTNKIVDVLRITN